MFKNVTILAAATAATALLWLVCHLFVFIFTRRRLVLFVSALVENFVEPEKSEERSISQRGMSRWDAIGCNTIVMQHYSREGREEESGVEFRNRWIAIVSSLWRRMAGGIYKTLPFLCQVSASILITRFRLPRESDSEIAAQKKSSLSYVFGSS